MNINKIIPNENGTIVIKKIKYDEFNKEIIKNYKSLKLNKGENILYSQVEIYNILILNEDATMYSYSGTFTSTDATKDIFILTNSGEVYVLESPIIEVKSTQDIFEYWLDDGDDLDSIKEWEKYCDMLKKLIKKYSVKYIANGVV